MSLPAVLSAMRELILDRSELPATFEERLQNYRQSFPKLAQSELEDLAKIDPNGFKTYRISSFVTQRMLIRRYLEITSALVEQFYLKSDRGFRFLDLVQNAHLKRSWRSNSCKELLNNFIEYVTEDCDDLKRDIPGLKDVANFEFLEYLATDTPVIPTAKPILSVAEIAALTVAELLNLKFSVLANSNLIKLEHSVLKLNADFYQNGKVAQVGLLVPEINYVGVGCGLDFKPSWIELDHSLYRYLNALRVGSEYPVTEFAAAAIEAHQALPENQQFLHFVSKLTVAVKAGVLVLRKP